MFRTIVIALWISSAIWVACHRQAVKSETLQIPDRIEFSLPKAVVEPLSSGKTRITLSASGGPAPFLDAYYASQLAFGTREESLRVQSVRFTVLDPAFSGSIDSLEVSIRPARRNDFLPLAYLAAPSIRPGKDQAIPLIGYELADFSSAFPAALVAQVTLEMVVSDAGTDLPEDLVIDLVWDLKTSYKVSR